MQPTQKLKALDRQLCRYILENEPIGGVNDKKHIFECDKKQIDSFYKKMIVRKAEEFQSEASNTSQTKLKLKDENSITQKEYERSLHRLKAHQLCYDDRGQKLDADKQTQKVSMNFCPLVNKKQVKKFDSQHLKGRNQPIESESKIKKSNKLLKQANQKLLKSELEVAKQMHRENTLLLQRSRLARSQYVSIKTIETENRPDMGPKNKHPVKNGSHKFNNCEQFKTKKSSLLEIYQEMYEQYISSKSQSSTIEQNKKAAPKRHFTGIGLNSTVANVQNNRRREFNRSNNKYLLKVAQNQK